MASDFYCDQVLSGKTLVEVVVDTPSVMAFHHTRPYWPVHIVVIPKIHIPSLLALDLQGADIDLLKDLLRVVQQVARQVTEQHGGCHVVTNLGKYQDSGHLHWHIGSGQPVR